MSERFNCHLEMISVFIRKLLCEFREFSCILIFQSVELVSSLSRLDREPDLNFREQSAKPIPLLDGMDGVLVGRSRNEGALRYSPDYCPSERLLAIAGQ